MVWLDSAAISFEEGSQTAAFAMYKNGLAVDFIAQTLNISLENAQSWLSQ
jgi:hypothetical protein